MRKEDRKKGSDIDYDASTTKKPFTNINRSRVSVSEKIKKFQDFSGGGTVVGQNQGAQCLN